MLSPVQIYTGAGDRGDTALYFGGRVSKADPAIECVGDVDETVTALGIARAHCSDAQLASRLLALQRDLFVLGAELAANPGRLDRLCDGVSRVTPQMVRELELLIDRLVADRPLRPVFIVPGATQASAAIDHARAVARRAERHAVAARQAGLHVADSVTAYLNRLSDLLFVLARRAADDAEEEPSRPGQEHRTP
jgi:cob(I)alamin adenosyltransferase